MLEGLKIVFMSESDNIPYVIAKNSADQHLIAVWTGSWDMLDGMWIGNDALQSANDFMWNTFSADWYRSHS